MIYEAYINSTRWRNNPARLAELKASGFRCRLCHASETEVELQVHHRTYARLGHELAGDLLTLCKDCHHGVTDMLRRRRYTVRKPKFADVIPSIESAVSLVDPTR